MRETELFETDTGPDAEATEDMVRIDIEPLGGEQARAVVMIIRLACA